MQPETPQIVDEDPFGIEEEDKPGAEVPATAREFPIFTRTVDLIRRKSEITKELKQINEELGKLQPVVLSYFAQHSLYDGISVAGWKLYMRRELWARPKAPNSAAEVCAAMKATGFGHFVHDTYNTSTFSAHVRELERKHSGEIQRGEIPDVSAVLPRALAAVLNVTPDIKLMGKPSKRQKYEENENA